MSKVTPRGWGEFVAALSPLAGLQFSLLRYESTDLTSSFLFISAKGLLLFIEIHIH